MSFQLNPQNPRILAVFQPQAWVNDCAVDIDGRTEVDVTGQVLELPLEEIHAMEDAEYNSDDLVDLEVLGHNGPFTVAVTEQMCAFFGVEKQQEITEEKLLAARAVALKQPD